jgi:hypothetical protein
MTVQFYPNGIGGSAPGDSLDLARPLQTTGNVWYVSSLIGIDAASPAGQNREKPLATLAQAVTNAASDDIVVFLTGHTETLVAAQAVVKRLTFIGEGTSLGKPSVSFRTNAAVSALFTLSGTNIELRNIYFPEALQADSIAKIQWSGTAGRVVGCYFELGAKDTAGALQLAASDQMRIESSTFISTATLTSAQPGYAIRSTGTLADLEISNTVISAGTVGFSNFSAVDLTLGAATRCRFTGLSLLLGADIAMGAAATGYVNVQLSTGGSRVAWA